LNLKSQGSRLLLRQAEKLEMPVADLLPVEILYIGGPTATLLVAGVKFIIDPTFDVAGKEYRRGAITLKKLVGPAVAAKALGGIDVALVSHDQHPDNLDDAGRALLTGIPRVMTTRVGAQRLGHGTVGLAPWQSTTIPTAAGVAGKESLTTLISKMDPDPSADADDDAWA
jgi:hypothetical protein